MSLTNLPVVSLLRERMQWHQARQKVLAENVANANMPGFQPRDLQPMRRGTGAAAGAGSGGVQLDLTNPLHLASASASEAAGTRPAERFETRPSGNAVSLEDEMMKVADNQSEYQLAASLYQKSLALLRAAAGAKNG